MSTTYTRQEWLLDLLEAPAGTNLTAHTPNAGGPWTAVGAHVPKINAAAELYLTGFDGGDLTRPLVIAPATPTANVWAQTLLKLIDTSGDNWWAGVAARYTDVDNQYALYYQSINGFWWLTKNVAGALTDLASGDAGVVDGDSLGLALAIDGTTLTPIVQGVVQDPVTDADLAGPGRCGLVFGTEDSISPTNGIHLRQPLFAYRP